MRVLVIAGEPAFIVARKSTHPITNLHLGGTRAEGDRVLPVAGEAAWTAMLESASRAARCHDAFQVGVDVAFSARFKGHFVIEANAFGDLLNGVTTDGLDPYRFQIRRLSERFSRARSEGLAAASMG